MTSKRTIAFIGCGTMGAAMVGHLIDAGYELRVFNRTPEKCAPLVARGAQLAPDVASAVRDADVGGLFVRKHQFIGLAEGKVKLADDTLNGLLRKFASFIPECENLTLYYGRGIKEAEAEEMVDIISAGVGDRAGDVSAVYGGQPVYCCIIAAEK